MKSIREVSSILRSSVAERAIRQADLHEQAGISQRTLTNVLSGSEDYKLSTLLSVADRLGLELALVPKAMNAAVQAGPTSEPRVKSRVAAALDRIKRPEEFHARSVDQMRSDASRWENLGSVLRRSESVASFPAPAAVKTMSRSRKK
ncbi:hypothetical protein ASD88_18950 [Pelomonas sp. Root662]|jgi:transcriptional regulator with XRE-family HTH domain|nr:hypothetical protein ASD88_18950 [Pelomonas sp. Root662]